MHYFFIFTLALTLVSCECSRKKDSDSTPSADGSNLPNAPASSGLPKAEDFEFPIQDYLEQENIQTALSGKDVFILDIKPGKGATYTGDKQVTIDFVGWLKGGSRFDSTLKRGASLTFLSGANRVIIGMERGLEGMKVGGERLIVVPPKYGYGRLGIKGRIPPESYLIYRILFRGME